MSTSTHPGSSQKYRVRRDGVTLRSRRRLGFSWPCPDLIAEVELEGPEEIRGRFGSRSREMSTLVLSRSDVAELLDMGEVMAVVEQAFRDHATGRTQMPPKVYLQLNQGDFRRCRQWCRALLV